MKKRRANTSFSNIGDVLDRVLHRYRPMADQSLIRVWDLWEETVGANIAANASPAAFKGDILLVYVSNSTWLHHLRFLESDLIEKLNGALGAERVGKINLKIGPV
ncbi:MAG: DUF721 domain-containing protein [Desulfobacteraceae bacterium]